MKRLYSSLFVAVMLGTAANAASWEPMKIGFPALKVHVTESGRILASDYDYINTSGGIFYSDDQGVTWTKTETPDYFYWDFCETPKYIFSPGFGARVARSEDNGSTWLVLNFEKLAEQYLDPKAMDDLQYMQSNNAVYDTEHSRLFVSVLSQDLGVIYSDDDGETWKRTNIDGLLLNYDAEKDIKEYDNIYDVVYFNGSVYALGIVCHYKYDYDTDSWTRIKGDSNFLARTTQMNGTLYAARSMENSDFSLVPFMERTDNMTDWTAMSAPENAKSSYINGLAHDGTTLFAASLYEGVYYTSDNGATWGATGQEGMPMGNPEEWENASLPTGIAVDKDYIYLACFDALSSKAGIYRMAKPTVGITTVSNDNGFTVTFNGQTLMTDVEANIAVMNTAGACVLNAKGTSANLSMLPAGVYVYHATAGTDHVTGKVVLR